MHQRDDARATGKPPLLRTQDLSRAVHGTLIVDDITVEIRAGEVLAIVGSSGSGKSSFLRLLNRLDEPTRGTVFLEGLDYRSIPPRELRQKLGMVTQRAFLFPGNVARNINFGPLQRGAELSRDAVERLLGQVGLPGYANRDVTNLSGGEAQRVSLARALANSPIVLLMDEPTSALDEDSKREVETLIRQVIADTHLTCVIVTHDMAQAALLGNRVMLMQSGRAVRIGGVEEVLNA